MNQNKTPLKKEEYYTSFKEAIAKGEGAEAQLRHAIKITGLGLWEWYLDTDRVLMSDEVFDITGASREDFDGTITYVVGKMIHPEDRINFMKSMSLVRKDGLIRERPYRVNNPNKSKCWIKFFSKLVVDSKGNPLKLVGTLIDITDDYIKESSLKASLNFMEAIVETLPTPIYYKNSQGSYAFCNQAFSNYFGKDKNQIIGTTLRDYVSKSYEKTYENADKEIIETKKAQSYEGKVIHKDGLEHHVLFSRSAHVDSTGAVRGIVGIMQDVTHQKSIEREVDMLYKTKDVFLNTNRNMMSYKSEREFFESIQRSLLDVFDHATQSSVLSIDENECLTVFVNEGFDDQEAESMIIPFKDSFIWHESNGVLTRPIIINDLIDKTKITYPKIIATKSGEKVQSVLTIPLIVEGHLRWVLSFDSQKNNIYDDIDQFVADYIFEELPIVYRMFDLYQKTLKLSRYDGLTGLMNRRYFEYVFEEKMNRAFYNKKPLIVGLLDLDGLKKVNDNYGHHAGDAYLKAFVAILSKYYKGADMLARIGGDEFTCLIDDKSLDELNMELDQIRKEFEKTEIICENLSFNGSFSFGFSTYPSDSKKMSELLHIADDNMYRDKQRHR